MTTESGEEEEEEEEEEMEEVEREAEDVGWFDREET